MDRPTKTGFGGGFVLFAFFLLLLPGCQKTRKYTLTGRVISKQPGLQQLIIANDDMPGFMPAMTMPFAVKDPRGFDGVQPGGSLFARI